MGVEIDRAFTREISDCKDIMQNDPKFAKVYMKEKKDLLEVLDKGDKNLYKKEDTLCTVGLLTGNILMVFILKGATLALHFYLYQFKLFNISEILPIWALWILTFVMIDFVFYFYHRNHVSIEDHK